MGAMLMAIAVPLCVFLYAILREAFWAQPHPGGSILTELYHDPDLRKAARNTLIVVIAVSLTATSLGTLLALVATKSQMKASRIFQMMQFVPLTIPSFVGAIGWVFLASPRAGWLNVAIGEVTGNTDAGPLNIFGVWGVIWVSTLYVTPFAFTIMVGAFERCSSETFEAYISNGTPGWLAAVRIVTGVLRPALVGAFILAMVEATIQFSVPLILHYDVLTTRLYEFALWSSPPRTDMASALAIAFLLLGGIVTLIEWFLVGRRRYASLSGRGLQGTSWKLGKGVRPTLKAIAAVYILAAVVLPVCGIIVVSLVPYWTPRVKVLTLDNYRTILSATGFQQGMENSLRLAVGTALAVVIVATVISILRSSSRHQRLASALYLVGSFPIAVPGLVFGLGALIAYLNGPFELYGTAFGFGIVYVLHFLPLGLRNIAPVVMQVGPELQESARTSGARPGRVLRDVTLPMIAPGLAACGTIVFTFTLREFPISSLLSTPTYKVASVYLVDSFQNGVFPQVAAMALVFCVVGMAAVVVTQLASSRVRFGQKVRRKLKAAEPPGTSRPPDGEEDEASTHSALAQRESIPQA